jgi:hypothetical protein
MYEWSYETSIDINNDGVPLNVIAWQGSGATLNESLYHAGRTELDNVQHAQMDRDKTKAETRSLGSRRASAEWAVARVLQPTRFPDSPFGQVHLLVEAKQWRNPGENEPPPAHVGD